MKKLLLINPVGQTSGYLLSKFSTIPPLSLAYIAAVTPSDWEVSIVDENFGPISYENAEIGDTGNNLLRGNLDIDAAEDKNLTQDQSSEADLNRTKFQVDRELADTEREIY